MNRLPKAPPNKPVTTLKDLPRKLREQMVPKGVDGKKLPPPPRTPAKKVRVAKEGSTSVKVGYVVRPFDNILFDAASAVGDGATAVGRAALLPTKLVTIPASGLADRVMSGRAKKRHLDALGRRSGARAAAEAAHFLDQKKGLVNLFPEKAPARLLESGPTSRALRLADAHTKYEMNRYAKLRARRAAAALSLGALAAAGIKGFTN